MKGVQLPLSVGRRPAPAFDNFVTGDNAEIVAALRGAPQELQLWGAPGSGKSHLLQARARSQPGALYLPLAELEAATTIALVEGAFGAPWLGLDDLQRLPTEPAASLALLRCIDERGRRGLPTVVAGRRPAGELPALLRDLQTRLSRFALWQLQPLDEGVLRHWLQQSARRRGLELADAAADWMLSHLPRDPGSLDERLQRLDQAALAARRNRITLPFLKSVLGLR